MSEILVSVIIPFFKNREWLEEAIESVLKQSYKNIEILVINDGSNEDLSKIIEKYKLNIIYIKQKNKGAAYSRNIGIKLSSGQYIAFLDSDDIWRNNKIEKQLNYMLKNNEVWTHTNYSIFGEKIKRKIKDLSHFQGDILFESLAVCPIATPCVMVKSSILKENNKLRFEVGMDSGEDYILWLKLASLYKLGIVDEDLTKVRIRGSNSANLAYSQLQSRAMTWQMIKENKIMGISINEISIITKSAYKISTIFYNLVISLDIDKNNQRKVESLSKILYFFPWILFKTQRQKKKGEKNESINNY